MKSDVQNQEDKDDDERTQSITNKRLKRPISIHFYQGASFLGEECEIRNLDSLTRVLKKVEIYETIAQRNVHSGCADSRLYSIFCPR